MEATSVPQAREAILQMLRFRGGEQDDETVRGYLKAASEFNLDVVVKACEVESKRKKRGMMLGDFVSACRQYDRKDLPTYLRWLNCEREVVLDVCSKYRRFGCSDQHGEELLPRLMQLARVSSQDIEEYEKREAAGEISREGWMV